MNRQSVANPQSSQNTSLHPAPNNSQQNRIKSNHANILKSQQIDYDYIYSNSHFNYDFSTIPNRLGAPYPIQPKLKIGQPNDKYEQEADRVAEQVMRMPEPATLQRKCVCNGTCPKCQPKQNKHIQSEISPLIQRQEITKESDDDELIQTKSKTKATPEVTPGITASIQSLGNGQPLSQSERNFFEPRFGADFSYVRVHSDSRAANAAKSINARAFTCGHNIAFNKGEYSPDSTAGQKLLAHELTHVIQQENRLNRMVQRLTCGDIESCQNLGQDESNRFARELRQGIARMRDFRRQPELLFGRQLNQQQRRNIRRSIRLAIRLSRELLNLLPNIDSHNSFSICICTDACPGGDACYNSATKQIRIDLNAQREIDRFTAASLLHEYLHFKQDIERSEAVIASRRAYIHTSLDELYKEYQGILVGAIFSADPIQPHNSRNESSSEDSSEEPPEGSHVLSPRGVDSDSGQEFFEVSGSREALNYALLGRSGIQEDDVDLLSSLSQAYATQIQTNSPVIFYGVRWREDSQQLILYGSRGNRINLGRFDNQAIQSEQRIKNAFWNSEEASRYELGGYNRGVLIIHNRNNIIAQIFINRRPEPPSEERQIRSFVN